MNRRSVLRKSLRAFLVGLGVSAFSGSSSGIHTTRQPNHVTLEFNQTKLERYRPLLVTRDLDVLPNSLYGQWTTSTEKDTDVAVYWADYPFQQGISKLDSHFGDHEPIYVFVDSDSGAVEKVIYSGYHWLKAVSSSPNLFNTDQSKFKVVQKWHHYQETPEEGINVDLKDLTDGTFQSWLDNGMEQELHPGSVVNPWSMEKRGYWWRDNALGFSTRALLQVVKLNVGVEGGNESDL